MRAILVLLAAAVVVVILVTVLGFIGPVMAGIGVSAAAVVVVDPGGVGARIRRSPAWWGIPGMRANSARAAPFAAMVVLYTVPVPLAAFALTHAALGNHGQGFAPIAGVGGVGGGAAPSSSPTALFTPPPLTQPSDTPSPDATVAATLPTAAPSAAGDNRCGAPANPWHYNFCGGSPLTAPPANFCDYFNCIASFWKSTRGFVDECQDGTYSHSGGQPGACASHGGERRPLDR